MRHFSGILAALIAIASAGVPAQAQDWPSRQVNIINPFSAGTTTDTVARVVADRLQKKTGKAFIVGDRLTLADILLYCFLTFGAGVGQPLNPENKNVNAWYERMKARTSASA